MKYFAIFILLVSFLQGDTILKIATYNVENLFDLKKSGYEYREFIPNTNAKWNLKNYKIKLKNISRVIKDVNADIIALQEIESLQSLKDLRYTLKQLGCYYPYYKIANYKNTTTKVALLSKIPFIYTHEIAVSSSYRYRNILEAKFKIDGQELYLLVNHWKSKSGPESKRVFSAKKLFKRTNEIGKDKNIILLGDFNSDYEENILFKRKRKHNDTDGITGINNILHTIHYKNRASDTKISEGNFYNLWYDTDRDKRYSYIYRGKKEALDNILISSSLLKNGGIVYLNNSIKLFQPLYLFKGKRIYRWQMSRKKPRVHKGSGYSDHLCLTAKFLVK